MKNESKMVEGINFDKNFDSGREIKTRWGMTSSSSSSALHGLTYTVSRHRDYNLARLLKLSVRIFRVQAAPTEYSRIRLAAAATASANLVDVALK